MTKQLNSQPSKQLIKNQNNRKLFLFNFEMRFFWEKRVRCDAISMRLPSLLCTHHAYNAKSFEIIFFYRQQKNIEKIIIRVPQTNIYRVLFRSITSYNKPKNVVNCRSCLDFIY